MQKNNGIMLKTVRRTRRSFRAVTRVFFIALRAQAFAGMGAVVAAEDTALYWSIHKDGGQVGYLLGTIHSEDPRVLDFPAGFVSQLTSNQLFAMEMVPDLPTLNRLTEYMQYQDGKTLESQVGPERFALLQSELSLYGVPDEWITRMKVWAAMMTLSVPPPETGFFMDFSLSLRAAGGGLKVVGLETLEQQLSFLEDMPMAQQLALLDQALEDYDKVEQIHRQMVENYLNGNLQKLTSEAEAQLGQLAPDVRQYFMEQGIDARNLRMLDSLLLHFESGRVFIAVGALHLPGEKGLINLLRQRGFDLQPRELPFSGGAPATNP